MEDENTKEVNAQIQLLCIKYQSERVNGNWYIEPLGLKKVAELIGGSYQALTKKQRKVFRSACVDNVHVGSDVKTWWYYINQEL